MVFRFALLLCSAGVLLGQGGSRFALTPRAPVFDDVNEQSFSARATKRGPGTIEITAVERGVTATFTLTLEGPPSVTGVSLGGYMQATPPAEFKLTQNFVNTFSQNTIVFGFTFASSCPLNLASGSRTCPIDALPLSTEGDLIFLPFTIRFSLNSFFLSREIRGTFVFGVSGLEDRIHILASLPEAGQLIEAGQTPPIFAFVEYELLTQDDAELFLELTFEGPVGLLPAGSVASVSSTYRVQRGKRRVGSGNGSDEFLKIDPFLLPDTSSHLILKAWIGERGGRSRLAGSAPITIRVQPAGKLITEFGFFSESRGFESSAEAQSFALLAPHYINELGAPGRPLAMRVTSETHDFTKGNLSIEYLNTPLQGSAWPVLETYARQVVRQEKEAVFLLSTRVEPGSKSYAFRARFLSQSGQVSFSDFAELPVESLQLAKGAQPDPDIKNDQGLIPLVVKGAAQEFSIPLTLSVARRDQKLFRCVLSTETFYSFGAPRTLPCEVLQETLTPGVINYLDRFTYTAPSNNGYLYFGYFIGPAADALSGRVAWVDGPYYRLKEAPTLLQASAETLVNFTKGKIDKAKANADRLVNVEAPRAKTILWAADTVKVIWGKDPVGGKGKGATVDAAQMLPLRTGVAFDPAIPKNGSFSGELTLQYDPADFPDDPNFDESKIEIVALNPSTGELERLGGQLDRASRSIRVPIDSLSPVYGLAAAKTPKQTYASLPVSPASPTSEPAVVMVNLSTEPVTSQLAAFDRIGTAAAAAPPAALAPRAQMSGTVRSLFPSQESSELVQLRASNTGVAGLALLTNGTAFESAPMQTESVRFSALPRVESSSSVTTELQIANASNFENEFTVYLYAPDGRELGTAYRSLLAKEKFRGDIRQLFPTQITENFTGHAQISAFEPVAALATYSHGPSMAVSAAQSLTGPATSATKLYSPLLASGVRLYVINKGAETAALTLRAFRDAGTAIGSPVNIELASGAQYSGDLGVIFDPLLNDGDAGWLQIDSTRPGILGEISFGDNFPTAKTRASLPLSHELPKSAVIPLAMHNAAMQTNLSIASPGAASSVRVTVVSREGATVGFAPATIPANGRLTRPLSDWVPAAANLPGGYITIDSNQPIVAYGVLTPISGADYASIPAMPMPAGSTPVAPPPGIAADPASLDFGSVNVGQTRDLVIRLNNRGTSTIAVSAIASSNARFTHTQPSTPFNIGAGSFQNITVRFSPNAAGAQSGTLSITSNDQAQPTLAVPLAGSGAGSTAAPGIELNPTALDFGTVTAGQTKDLAVRVNNRGTATLTVNSITSSNALFTITQPSRPFNVGPGSFQDFAVRFSPNAAGAQSGALTVASTDSARPSLTVAVAGTGAGGSGGGGGGGGSSTQITPLSAAGWPNGRVSNNLPPAAIDGNVSTFTWTTESFNTAVPSYLGVDLGPAKAVSRIRLYKDSDGGGGQNVKNLVIQYTTSDASMALPSRTWTTVTGLVNGFRGAELLTAQSVSADGIVSMDSHNSLASSAWASLSFNRVNATGIRIGFQNPGGATFVNHYKVHELQVYNDEGAAAGSREVLLTVDDGSFENAIGIPAGAPLVYFVNRLTPPSYPATLKRIQLFFGNTATDLPAGHPVTLLFGSSGGAANINGTAFQRVNSSIAATGIFNELTLTTPVTITSGDFVIGFSTSNPAGRFPATIDETISRQRSYISTDGSAFTLIDQAGAPGNLAIRAVVEAP